MPSERSPEDPRLRALMAAYQAGRADAFDALHDALTGDLRTYLASLARDAADADDLVQETFLQIHRARASHTPGEPVRPWAFAIAKRVFLMSRRGARRRQRHEERFSIERAGAPTPSHADRLDARQTVEAALRQAPSEARRPFVWRHLFGLSFDEIAGRLGIRQGAAKMRSSRAASLMRAWLREGRDD